MSPKNLQALGRVTWQRSARTLQISWCLIKFMQVFMCLFVSSLGLLFTFHVYSFKWVLISILIWNGFVKYQNRKKSTIIFGNRTSDVKLGFVKNCLNSITLWLANMTILLFMQMFETWYFCFSHKAKGIQHDPLVFWKLKSNVLSK